MCGEGTGVRTSCIDSPSRRTTPWFDIRAGFLSRTTASVRWNSAILRIMVFADIIAMSLDYGVKYNSRNWRCALRQLWL